MNVTLITALVNRDAMTRIPTTVPGHELAVLQAVFGEDNVQVTNEDAGTVELDPSLEGERLVSKYGDAVIVELFGTNYKGAVSKALSSYEVTAKPTKAKALAPA